MFRNSLESCRIYSLQFIVEKIKKRNFRKCQNILIIQVDLFKGFKMSAALGTLTISRRRYLSYRNQSNYLLCKSMDLFLYDRDLRHERVQRKETLMLKVNDVQNNTHCSMSAMEIPEICMKYLFKVNINDTRTKSMTFFWCLYF